MSRLLQRAGEQPPRRGAGIVPAPGRSGRRRHSTGVESHIAAIRLDRERVSNSMCKNRASGMSVAVAEARRQV